MQSIFLEAFGLAFLVSFIATFLVSRVAVRRKIIDFPDEERRFHKSPTPTLGGVAIFSSFFLVTLFVGVLGGYLLNGTLPLRVLLGIWAGGFILMIGGYLDDRYRMPPSYTVIFPVLAALTIVFSGIHAVTVHNPFSGQIIQLNQSLFGFPIISALIVFLWTLGMTYTTKLLDGMDGLVTGISAIGAVVIFLLSLTPQVMQTPTAFLAITLAGALFGFLILNFYPAKIFLGEGGSTFAGFMLGVLAIVSGGKIATALLVMGIPLLDALWVILQRLFNRQSPFSGDRRHLHFRLLDIGFSEPQAVLFLYAISGFFGATALFLQSLGKLVALMIMVGVMALLVSFIFFIVKPKQN
ncbi:MAG: undecaprenyl/decaprenyl-phosphate alpha-N-acetylglucosaminyl 1-phosphate transferase [Candidatus Doudnabacteria bacterium]|nr:undecaprenyl/decaprenyl-phosphate alpha-N-acetylglucosaminyl 1-phosphate transferase [Candidatus Doudnabacteria bacterium]